MKGEVALRALQLLEEVTYNSLELMFAAFIKDTKVDYRALRKFQFHTHNTVAERLLIEKQERQRFTTLISRLYTDGLIQKERNNNTTIISITAKGRQKVSELADIIKKHGLPAGRYHVKKEKRLTIISYDIPETEKRKRTWLRTVLRRHNFQMLHQSTWMGMIQLPRQFIDDLRELRLLSFVEIFSISKTGSLKKIS